MITVGFSRHKGFAPISWIIMLCEHTPFSHAYIKVRSESLDRTLVYQATGSGVHFIGSAMFEESAQVIEEYEMPMPSEDRKKLLQWCVDNAGKPYGRLQVIGIGLIRLAKLFGLRISNPFSNGNKAYICCELVTAALEHTGMAGPDDLDQVDLIATRDMVRLVDEKSKT
mgnify:CR=1 FL=1